MSETKLCTTCNGSRKTFETVPNRPNGNWIDCPTCTPTYVNVQLEQNEVQQGIAELQKDNWIPDGIVLPVREVEIGVDLAKGKRDDSHLMRMAPRCDADPTNDMTGKSLANHPFMKSELYEICRICYGTMKITIRDAASFGQPCPECEDSKTPGFTKIGMTIGQLERLKAEQEMLLELVCAIAQTGNSKYQDGVVLAAIIEQAADVIGKVNKSDVSAARFKIERTAKD